MWRRCRPKTRRPPEARRAGGTRAEGRHRLSTSGGHLREPYRPGQKARIGGRAGECQMQPVRLEPPAVAHAGADPVEYHDPLGVPARLPPSQRGVGAAFEPRLQMRHQHGHPVPPEDGERRSDVLLSHGTDGPERHRPLACPCGQTIRTNTGLLICTRRRPRPCPHGAPADRRSGHCADPADVVRHYDNGPASATSAPGRPEGAGPRTQRKGKRG